MHLLTPLSQHSPKRQSDQVLRTVPLMGTFVTIHVVGRAGNSKDRNRQEEAVDRALRWFTQVEESCTRFDAQSEAMRLTRQVGVAMPVSTLLFEAVQFALSVAEETGGSFDPTVGRTMEERGFDREYRTGRTIETCFDATRSVSYRDVKIDPERKTITLLRPLVLDLGAVAKGLAVDLAARELEEFENFAVNAGGDLYLGGRNPEGEPWSIGIRHPRNGDELIDRIRVSSCAVCTSGDYERRSPKDYGPHIVDPRSGALPNAAASVTVIAPTAMLADALATAAFVLGPSEGIELFNRLGVDGLIITPELERYATRGLRDYQ